MEAPVSAGRRVWLCWCGERDSSSQRSVRTCVRHCCAQRGFRPRGVVGRRILAFSFRQGPYEATLPMKRILHSSGCSPRITSMTASPSSLPVALYMARSPSRHPNALDTSAQTKIPRRMRARAIAVTAESPSCLAARTTTARDLLPRSDGALTVIESMLRPSPGRWLKLCSET